MRTGKDTSAEYLKETYGGSILKFADPLYDILTYAQKTCGFNVEKDRAFLRYIGSEWARAKDKDVWVRYLLDHVPDNGNVYVSDLRFVNEYKALKEHGWICVRIDRNTCERDNHESEVDLDGNIWDYIIENNGSLNDLYEELNKLVEQVLKYSISI